MLYNYFKIAVRTLYRHKGFSLINIAGLAIGMACTICILLWIGDELSYDRFHQHADKTYRVTASLADMNVEAAVTSAPLAEAIKTQVPAIAQTVLVSGLNTMLLQVGDRIFEEDDVIFTDAAFLETFSFPLIAGNPQTAFSNPDGILLTQSMAKKYFGDEQPMGKTIRMNHTKDFFVTGVLADIPSNSHIKFGFIRPMSAVAGSDENYKVWDNLNYYTYVRLHENTDASAEALAGIESQINAIYKANMPGDTRIFFHLQPLRHIHLRSSFLADLPGHGHIQYVYIFSVVAIFILAVACINFMNLATARSARRAKEVGLRKVAGAVRPQLIRQFLAESACVTAISLILALAIVLAALPYFNNLAGKQLTLSLLNGNVATQLLAITVITALLAGSYPAFFLSGFKPVAVLKGNLKSSAAGSLFRNSMVVLQFSVSIILLVGTAVVYKQLNFIQKHNLGFDKENLVYVPMRGELWPKYQPLRHALEQNTLTQNFTVVSELPTNLTNGTMSVQWEGKDPNSQPLFTNLAVDENFIDVFRIKLLNGRFFSKNFTADTASLVVNEAALKTMGMDVETAVGRPLNLWKHKAVIIGVVKDFNFKPIQQPIAPLILRLNTWGGIAVVRADPGKTEATVRAVGHVCKTIEPAYPFTFKFVDQDLNNLYQAEQRLGSVFNIFAILAIVISCLGLYGLSAFLAERRTKELGVRKVLGASTSHVAYLLLSSFTKPILIAMLLAAPLSALAMNHWLQTFAFHITLHWTIFLFALLTTLIIALITVTFESLKAALTNPTTALKND